MQLSTRLNCFKDGCWNITTSMYDEWFDGCRYLENESIKNYYVLRPLSLT